jgi:hypothetical protein
MQCLKDHTMPVGEERECPVCGQPARSVVSAERLSGLKTLGLALIFIVAL